MKTWIAKLYSQILDFCYQRQPIDVRGVTALALVSKDLSNMVKVEFLQMNGEFTKNKLRRTPCDGRLSGHSIL